MTLIRIKPHSLGLYILTFCFMIACTDEDKEEGTVGADVEAAADRGTSAPSPSESQDAQVDQSVLPEPALDQGRTDPENSELEFMPLSEAGDVVSFVEIPRYMGLWYEIATTPSFQQRACFNTEANYTFNEDQGWVEVVNRCAAGGPDGRRQEIQGRAELVDLETQAKLDVIFFNRRSPYWVVALDGAEGDQPYTWAVVSVPGSRTMWILSRSPTLTEGQRAEINAHLEARGFPIDTLIDTFQEEFGE
ncbi:MAG: lipocalin family protein [Myxococcota bacterium]|nr:lipocalin family protein [Myxococcota bacterium]